MKQCDMNVCKRRKQTKVEMKWWKIYGQKLFLLVAILVLTIQIQDVFGLKCYFGLGNTSERENQKVMNCPEGEMFVCKKMYGGGMGDQIRRYCEEVKANVYKDLKEMEKRKMNHTFDDTEDIECYADIDRGRKVTICECTTDLCNFATSTIYNNNVITNIKNYILISFLISYLNQTLKQGYI